ncbi:hypothetical protein F5Y18DRAFT_200754 [Xylariaceae sp. FL1019]|nr:hypothetical protein F5Y18DRAFT_200754 [Xylariaceae sp. FL1019]
MRAMISLLPSFVDCSVMCVVSWVVVGKIGANHHYRDLEWKWGWTYFLPQSLVEVAEPVEVRFLRLVSRSCFFNLAAICFGPSYAVRRSFLINSGKVTIVRRVYSYELA